MAEGLAFALIGFNIAIAVIAAYLVVSIVQLFFSFGDFRNVGFFEPGGSTPGVPGEAGAYGGRRWRGPIARWRDRRNRNRIRTEEEDLARLIREVTQAVTNMEANWDRMVRICNSLGFTVRQAFEFLDQPMPRAPLPGMTAAQIANIPRLEAQFAVLDNARRVWIDGWRILDGEFTRITNLNADLRRRVIRELTRPI
ncbi:hypothetical protein HYV81_06315 [Candidatus Woesearchaeota archaeon]|nr:hypothetical protein [Candidatus Woesearchaeota archaeon]